MQVEYILSIDTQNPLRGVDDHPVLFISGGLSIENAEG